MGGGLRLPSSLIVEQLASVLMILISNSLLTSTPDAIEKKQNTGKVEATINTWHMCNASKYDDMSCLITSNAT